MKVIEEFNDFARYAAALEPAARRIVNTTILRIEARTKLSLSGPRHGRLYRKYGYVGTIMHRASAPGEAPATDTGNLANSIRARMIGSTEGEVGVHAEYGLVLEMGGVHMAPRPYLGPAVKEEWPEFLNAMKALGV